MTHPVMADYLRALSSHTGPGLAPLPLAACADMLGLDGLGLLLSPGSDRTELVSPSASARSRWRICSKSRAKAPAWTPLGTEP